MTQKVKRPTRKNAKRGALRQLHVLRLSCFSVLAVGLLSVQLVAAVQNRVADRAQVLAYATNVSVGDLFAATNQARAANGLGPLALNAKLNNGAQAKANDMIAKNYWSHTAPDGTQPWAFFAAAGYSYTRAGENLAYGFDTSSQTVTGWMNSAGHRANILGSYSEVGFGIASGATYQGGENTVIVAFYATPQAAAPAPAPAPAPAAPVAPKKVTAAPTAPKPAPAPTPAPTPAPQPAPTPTPQPEKPQVAQKTAETPAQQPKKVTNLESALGGQANWAIYASLSVVGVTSIGFAGTHLQLIRRGWKLSKHYILVHPALDTAVVAALAAVILTSTAGYIK